MRIVRGAIVTAFVLAGGAALPGARQAGSSHSQVPPPRGAISGVVYDATSGQPVAAATVVLARIDGGQPIPRAVTDSQGRFVFRNLEPSDEYFLGARRFGYEYTRYGWSGPGQSLTIADILRISVARDQWVSGIRIPLWRPGSIAGRVLDERGEPLVGVAVRPFTRAMISGQEQLVVGDLVTTDDRGEYRMFISRPGRYSIAVLSVQSTVLQTTAEAPMTMAVGELATGGIGGGRGAMISRPGIDVDGRHRLVVTNFPTPPPPGLDRARAYPMTFHPGARLVSDARAIDVTYGDTHTGIDIHVMPVPAARVSGRLIMPDGTTPPPLLLRLLPTGLERLGFGAEAATTTVDDDGTFVFLNVPSGSYTLVAQASVMDFTTGSASTRLPDAPGFPAGGISVGSTSAAPGMGYLARHGAGTPVHGRTLVAVGDEPLTDVVVSLRRTARISGRLVLPQGMSPPEGLFLGIGAEPANGDPSLGQPSGRVDTSDPGLPFTVENLMGGVYLLGGLSSNNPTWAGSVRVASVTWQGRDVRYTGFDASTGTDFTDVIVTLTDKTVVLTGTVTDARGPAAAAVIVFPADSARWTNFGFGPRNFATVRSSSAGTFRIDSLPAGEYYLVAVDRAHFDAWVDPAFLAAAVPFAARVTLAWGETVSRDLKLAEGIGR